MPSIDPTVDAMNRLRHAGRAAARLRALADERDRRLGARSGIGGQLSDAADDMRHARRNLRAVRDAHEIRRATADQLHAAERDAKIAQREHDRIAALADEANSRLSLTSNVLDGAVAFLAGLPDDARVTDAGSAGKRGPKPADLRGAVDGVRSQIVKLRTEIERIERAPIPAAEAKERAREAIDALIAAGRPDVSGLLSAAPEPIRWPLMTHMPIASMGVHKIPAYDTPAALAWLAGEKTMFKRLCDDIDAIANDERAVPAAERDGQLANLRGQLLAVERREVELLETAASAGMVIEHRPDVDPRAVLAIEVETAASRDAA